MNHIVTNLFCIIGKPGTGKKVIIDSIFSNTKFINENNVSRFIYGTTRDIRNTDMNGVTYQFYTIEDYKNINSKDIIESRSYNDIFTGRTDYYFTLTKHIVFGKNYIGKTSLFQYEEIKKWVTKVQMTHPTLRIEVFPIYIQSPLENRLTRLLEASRCEADIYDICAKIVAERFEYRSILENKVIDRFSPNTCIIDNTMEIGIDHICKDIMKFVSLKIQKNGKGC